MLDAARRFPDAFWAGLEAVRDHYQAVADGLRAERPFPANPYARPDPNQGDYTEWHAWNTGWNQGLDSVARVETDAAS
jgi:hypothetical protein